MASTLQFLRGRLGLLRKSEGADSPDLDHDPLHEPNTTRFILGGLGESRQMYALDSEWQVLSHRKVDPATAKGIVIAADPALDLIRRIDHTASDRVQLAEFASDFGEVLLSVKTKARSGHAYWFSKKKKAGSDDQGETLRAVEAIQERGWWLCTPANRFQSMEPAVRVLPVASVLLKLLEAHSRIHPQEMDNGATVVVLVFPGAAQVDDYQIVCLATYTAVGQLEGLDFVPGSGLTIEQVVSNYASVRKLSADGVWPQERLILASSADPQIKKWLSSAQAYPRNQMVMGMPVQTATRLATTISGTVLAATLSYSAWAQWQVGEIRTSIEHVKADQINARMQAIAAVRERSLGHFLTHTGLDSQRAIDLAVMAWQPGTTVEMKASVERATLTVSTPLGQGDEDGGHSASPKHGASAAAALVNALPPSGCKTAATQVNSAMTQLVKTYECTLQNSELERLRNAGF